MKIIINYINEYNLKEKIGKIDFWNDSNYFLTENYMIIKYKSKIYCFEYKDILKIFYEDKLYIDRGSGHSRYLHIVVDGLDDFRILIQSTSISYQNTNDISEYLLNKNKKIIVDDSVELTNFNIFRW